MIQADNKGLVLITGGTGFVGQNVARSLVQHGFHARILARNAVKAVADNPQVQFHKGNALDLQSVKTAADGCDGIIHLIGIIRETRSQSFEQAHVRATENVLNAAIAGGVRRFVHMSALGTRPNADSEYHKTKWRAEQLVCGSPLAWTIFRPGLIHGPDGEFTRMVVQWHDGKAPPFLFMPFFGAGFWGQRAVTHIQPILVRDVAELFVRALETVESEKKTYEVGGPEKMTWPTMLEVFNSVLPGPRRAVVGIPFWLARLLSIFPLPGLPFNRDQVIMAGEESICDLAAVERDFYGFLPRTLEASVREYTTCPME